MVRPPVPFAEEHQQDESQADEDQGVAVLVAESQGKDLVGWDQDERGRLWDILWMLRFAILKARPAQDRLSFALYVRNDNHRPRLVKLLATCGPLDMDDPQPAITVMMPGED